MELTEKERLMLVKKKEIICGATLKILDMAHDPKNALEIKKNMTHVLSELNSISSYSDSKNVDLNQFTKAVNALFDLMSGEKDIGTWILSPRAIETVCNYANSIRFDFTKKDFKIHIPKIDISIFRKG
jgi:hypothetical protein